MNDNKTVLRHLCMNSASLEMKPPTDTDNVHWDFGRCTQGADTLKTWKLLGIIYSMHTHTFNGPFSGTTQVSRYQKGKTNLDFTEARDSEWQWHQLGHMQVCSSLQTDNHASTPPLVFYRPDALPAAQPTASKHWRQLYLFNAKSRNV